MENKRSKQLILWAPGCECCHHRSGVQRGMQGKESRASCGLWLWTEKGLIKVDRQAMFTGNNNVSEPWGSSVPARRPRRPSYMPASGDLERRLA